MARLIDADKLKAHYAWWADLDGETKKLFDTIIDIQPTIEAEPKHGRWIYDDEAYPGGNPYGHYECDQCGESVPHKTNYCPNCGTDMREVEE